MSHSQSFPSDLIKAMFVPRISYFVFLILPMHEAIMPRRISLIRF